MEKSKYLDRFQLMAKEAKEAFQLIGDYILVEKIPVKEKKTAGGIILSLEDNGRQKNSLAQDLPTLVRVILVGEGYYDDETKSPIELNVKPGDIGLVGALSTKWFSDLEISDYKPYEIGLTREEEIKFLFRGQEGYERAFGLLNQGVKTQVEGGGQ
jgi:co-chaperonin GroES (HSP10)